MKKFALFTAILFVTLLSTGHQAQALDTKLTAAINKMKKIVHYPVRGWRMTDSLSKEEVLNPDTSNKKFRQGGIGLVWAKGPVEFWLRAKYVVPENIYTIPVAGSKIGFRANIEDHGEIYVNGELRQEFRRSGGYVVLTENAKPGEEFFIVVRAARKENDVGLIRDLSLDYSVLKDVERRIFGISESIGSLEMLLELSGESAAKWKDTLDSAADAIDFDALESGRIDDFFASLEKCIQILSPVTSIVRKYSMLLVGYSHIDPAWLWDKKEGEHIVWKGTSEQILKLMEDFPDFIYAANQMHCYRWMETDYPDLFKRIKEKIAEGRWEPVGAEWVEPDGNLPSGESFVRQFMYGRKYSKEKFGKVSTIGWTPDSFGYNWNLPQILAKSDMRGFVTQKISWNDTTRFPHNLYWWESPDGSRVLVYFPQGGYGESVQGGTMASQLVNIKQKHGVDSNLVIFGVGDHGGGIPRDYVERAFALKDNPLYPEIEFITVEEIFDRMFEADKTLHFPTWKDELYLEYHRGTYTTQSNTKNNNRRNEHRLMNAERFSSIASFIAGVKYPFEKIEEAWKILLFNQFHDILPGSSITPVYKDADEDHGWVAKQTEEAIDAALEAIAAQADTTGEGTPLVLFNGLSWTRDDVIEVKLSAGVAEASVFNDEGKEIAVQIIDKGDDAKAALFAAREIPPMGFAVYRLVEGRKSTAAGGMLKVVDNTLENERLRVKVDPKTGWVVSIFDKSLNREIVGAGKAAFQLQAYTERPDSDAWDMRFAPDGSGQIPPEGSRMEMPDAEEVSIVESGPVRVTIMSKRKFNKRSVFKQYYSLVDGMGIVYGRLDAQWNEVNVFLKSAFNLNLDADYATFEIPYATIQRATKPKTAAERAKWEMSGHRWVDYTGNKKDYGVSLLSFSKYGYDVKNNVLRMTMLRAPTSPDPLADRGKHSIPYALYPHGMNWDSADVPRRAAEYNDPVIVLKTTKHEGKLGKSYGFFSAGQEAVISTIKRAENGDGFILRLVETDGIDGVQTIGLPAKPKKVVETNLVERDLKELAIPSGALEVPLGHYEIKSLRIVF
ncbi:MAG: glycoside hydrolase family 38 C-terminal domain-containing protein [bacterium]